MRQAIIWTNADLIHRRIYASVGGMNLWIHMNGLPPAQSSWSPRGETTHSGVDVNNTHLSMINPDYNMMQAISVTIH